MTADSVCKVLLPLLKSKETNTLVHVCTICYYLLCQSELHDVVFYSGLIKALCDIVRGYNLLAIEHALWSLDIYCTSEDNINQICSPQVIESLDTVVDSSITNIRMHSQSILSKIARLKDSMFYQQIKDLRQKSPWSRVGAEWKSDVWKIPLPQ